MKLLIGLGNRGSKYSHTRHNLGRLCIQSIADSLNLKFSKQKALSASVAIGVWEEERVMFAYPETYMNVSGKAVRALSDHCEIDPEQDLLIVVDDLALPFESLRLRSKGSDGGHNGLKSIERSLGIQTYPRLRLGIGMVTPTTITEEFVLEAFKSEEIRKMPDLFGQCQEACRLWVSSPIEVAMNVVNTSQI